MKPYKIIDVHSSFLCNDLFQQAGSRDDESDEDDLFTGYAAADKYLSLDFDRPLNRSVLIPTGVTRMALKTHGRREV